MTRRSRIVCVSGWVLTVVLLIALAKTLSMLHGTAAWIEHGVQQATAVEVVGDTALLYLRDRGRAPRSITELFDAGYLRMYPDGQGTVAPLIAHVANTRSDVDALRLCFPSSADGYRVEDGFVVGTATGARLVVVDMPTGELTHRALLRANAEVALRWLRIVRKEPTGDPWFDDLPVTTSPSTTRP
jgi:hypothetical protein